MLRNSNAWCGSKTTVCICKPIDVSLLAATLLGFFITPPLACGDDLKSKPVEIVFPEAHPLNLQGDIASNMVDGIDRFLLRKIDASIAQRTQLWQQIFESSEPTGPSIQQLRDRLAHLLGVAEKRISPVKLERETLFDPKTNAAGPAVRASWVRWPVLQDPDPGRSITSVYGEGLLLEPIDSDTIVADVIAIPDCDQTPADICGLSEVLDSNRQFAKQLAEHRCRVLVPMLINRDIRPHHGRVELTNREFLYRASFELGRHVIGYEVDQVRSAIDWFGQSRPVGHSRPIGLIGSVEGGRIALATAAIDTRVDGLCVGGGFGTSNLIWKEPIDRNVFGYLNQFGNAECLCMVAPRKAIINHCQSTPKVFSGDKGGAPSELRSISFAEGHAEVERARQLAGPLIQSQRWSISETEMRDSPCDSKTTLQFLALLTAAEPPLLKPTRFPPIEMDQRAIQQRCVDQLDRHNQLLLRESPFVRRELMSDLRFDSLSAYEESITRYRDLFREEVIGNFKDPLLPFNARVRRTWQEPKWTGFEVVLDVFQDVIAYGVLLVPNDIKPGEKRPVVVCQHGLEGRPTDTFQGDHPAYHDFAAVLAERGFITFAPQNPYLFKDRFRSLQRKANLLGKTLFSVIVPQHQQIVNWLQSLPNVDGNRIAFYGLSYGGKSAMRIPALVTDYCLSICSADFNEWVIKNASTRDSFSYIGTGEYEIFEWNLGSTFNYSEMASLICPRPFMVERGHFDGVGADEWVAYEYAKVRHLYAARLGIGDRTEIEWFVGPHTINGKGSFEFLHRHLDWPMR